MAMRKLGNLCVGVRRYPDRDTGEQRTHFEAVGAMFEREDGTQVITIKRTFCPAGVPDLTGKGLGDSIFLAFFPEREREDRQGRPSQQQRQQPKQQQPQTAHEPAAYAPVSHHDDDIPF